MVFAWRLALGGWLCAFAAPLKEVLFALYRRCQVIWTPIELCVDLTGDIGTKDGLRADIGYGALLVAERFLAEWMGVGVDNTRDRRRGRRGSPVQYRGRRIRKAALRSTTSLSAHNRRLGISAVRSRCLICARVSSSGSTQRTSQIAAKVSLSLGRSRGVSERRPYSVAIQKSNGLSRCWAKALHTPQVLLFKSLDDRCRCLEQKPQGSWSRPYVCHQNSHMT